MALNFVEGGLGVGDGKSYYMVNRLIVQFLQETNRPIFTNLPCDGEQLDWLVSWVAARNQPRAEQYRSRIHFLHPGEEEVFGHFVQQMYPQAFDGQKWNDIELTVSPAEFQFLCTTNEETYRIEWRDIEFNGTDEDKQLQINHGLIRVDRRSLGKHDRVREFWYFTKPNSVILLDETADVCGSDDHKTGKRSQTLRSYVNQHRHFKDDLYFCAQSREDVDVQVRRRIQYVFYCENMKKLPIFDHWAFRQLRWPFQWFRVRKFLARNVWGKTAEQINQTVHLAMFPCWPTAREFRNYRSFSKASTLLGKQAARDDDKSSDLDTPWQRVRDFFAQAWMPLCVLVFFGVLLVGGVRFIRELSTTTSADIAKIIDKEKPHEPKTNSPVTVTRAKEPVTGRNRTVVDAAGETVTNLAPSVVAEKPETILFITPSRIRTTKRDIRPGDVVGGQLVLAITSKGVRVGDEWIEPRIFLQRGGSSSR